jgi:hypothetical protein
MKNQLRLSKIAKTRLNFSFLRLSSKVISWLIQSTYPELSSIDKKLQKLISTLDTIGKNHGLIFLVKYMKDLRTVFWSYLGGNPVKVKGVRVTSDGIPVVLAFVKDYNCKAPVVRLVNTILTSSRSLSLGKLADISSIVDGPKKLRLDLLPLNHDDFEKYVPGFWVELGFHRKPKLSIPRYLHFTSFHLSTKAGPNSKGFGNALWSAMNDFRNLLKYPDLLNSIKTVGGPELSHRISVLSNCFSELRLMIGSILPFGEDSPESNTIRRIVAFPDKELKMRVVAILDYWSQTSLRPLHS